MDKKVEYAPMTDIKHDVCTYTKEYRRQIKAGIEAIRTRPAPKVILSVCIAENYNTYARGRVWKLEAGYDYTVSVEAGTVIFKDYLQSGKVTANIQSISIMHPERYYSIFIQYVGSKEITNCYECGDDGE